jgi:ubiquitin carboxyl-terminal hydrolase 4/11/15
MKVLDFFSSSTKKNSELQDIFYYVLPASWLIRAWPFLTGSPGVSEDWREEIGSIHTDELLEGEKTVSDDEGKQKLQDLSSEKALRKDITHEKEFFLLGANAWMLVKEKFGVVGELRLNCVFYNADSPIAVQLRPDMFVPIPGSGRFPYEAHVAKAPSHKEHPGNVSDDETAELGDDLFPSTEPEDFDRMPVDDTQSNQPVLLLPASSTPADAMSNGDYNTLWKEDKPPLKRKPHGSGLGNLGNTCFMNSSLQCLAHTDPLRKYFLSGDYERDLNRENPLGTGGDLATQFAQLLGEMWTEQESTYMSSNSAVYPRNFKYALGKHAEQFIGYDQHDSQEFAAFLLDALHEDTNRVSKKPFVEKGEQREDETDEEASNIAWALHLKREDSRVLENFMGQVKSRVQCCKETCARVSTTFDPFMYLSVPIPGSAERTLPVTFVPLDPSKRHQLISVSVTKAGNFGEMLGKVLSKLKSVGFISSEETIPTADIKMADLWQGEVFKVYSEDEEIEIVRDTDQTFFYQLQPLHQVQEAERKSAAMEDDFEADPPEGLRDRNTPKRYQLDLATLKRLNDGSKAWEAELEKYLRGQLGFANAFNPKRGSSSERVKMYNQLLTFIDQCYADADPEITGQKRNREDSVETGKISVMPDEEVAAIRERCESSPIFESVTGRYDVAILEFLAGKMRQQILNLEKRRRENLPDGVCVQIMIRKFTKDKDSTVVAPFFLRLPSTTTVYGLREKIAEQLQRSLKTDTRYTSSGAGEPSSERPPENESFGAHSSSFGPAGLMIVRQMPLMFEVKSPYSSASNNHGNGRKLGVLEKEWCARSDGTRPPKLANPTDAEEQGMIGDFLGPNGVVWMEWPDEMAEKYLDVEEYNVTDTPGAEADARDAIDRRTRNGSQPLTVLECVEKYCQMEQLEETEMWYCNRCKEHVRAWKQLHLYRSPPILIIHLKRFQFSAKTHRRDKIGVFVDFPLQGLDLTSCVSFWTDEAKPIYDCYAVSNHYGGLGGGHYTAYALNDDGYWCHYDDSRMSSNVDPKEVISDAAYCLFYRRRDIPFGEDFPISLQTAGAPSPAIIRDPLDKSGDPGDDISSTNVAMVDDEDGMDIDDPMGTPPHSPMGSLDMDGGRLTPQNFDVPDGPLNESFDPRFQPPLQ